MDEQLSINDGVSMLRKLSVIEETLDYIDFDLQKYKQGFQINYLLDFSEIYPSLFRGSRPVPNDSSDIIEELLAHDVANVTYSLLPSTIWELLNKVLRNYQWARQKITNDFPYILKFAEALENGDKETRDQWMSKLIDSELYNILECLERTGSHNRIVKPVQSIKEWMAEGKIVPLPAFVGQEIYDNVKIDANILTESRFVLNRERPGLSVNNLLDASSIALTVGLNRGAYPEKRYLPLVNQSNPVLRVARKEFGTVRLGDSMLKAERYPKHVSSFISLLTKVGESNSDEIIKMARFLLPPTLQKLREQQLPEKLMQMNWAEREGYLRQNGQKPMFIDESTLRRISFFHAECGQYLQFNEDQVIPDTHLSPSGLAKNVGEWRATAELQDEMFEKSKKVAAEIRNLYGDFAALLPIDEDKQVKDVIDHFF